MMDEFRLKFWELVVVTAFSYAVGIVVGLVIG